MDPLTYLLQYYLQPCFKREGCRQAKKQRVSRNVGRMIRRLLWQAVAISGIRSNSALTLKQMGFRTVDSECHSTNDWQYVLNYLYSDRVACQQSH